MRISIILREKRGRWIQLRRLKIQRIQLNTKKKHNYISDPERNHEIFVLILYYRIFNCKFALNVDNSIYRVLNYIFDGLGISNDPWESSVRYKKNLQVKLKNFFERVFRDSSRLIIQWNDGKWKTNKKRKRKRKIWIFVELNGWM